MEKKKNGARGALRAFVLPISVALQWVNREASDIEITSINDAGPFRAQAAACVL